MKNKEKEVGKKLKEKDRNKKGEEKEVCFYTHRKRKKQQNWETTVTDKINEYITLTASLKTTSYYS